MFEDLVRGLMILVDRGFMTRGLADEIITHAVQNIYLHLEAGKKEVKKTESPQGQTGFPRIKK